MPKKSLTRMQPTLPSRSPTPTKRDSSRSASTRLSEFPTRSHKPHLDEHRRILSDDIYHNVLNILDFITGMNDHEAYRLAQELQGHWGTVV